MSKINVSKIGVTIISRANDDMQLIRKNIEVKGAYESEYEKRDLIREELKGMGIDHDEHLCFNCQNAEFDKCPKIKDTIKRLLLDDEAYDFIEMGVQVYENKIMKLLDSNEDEAILFNVQKCKKYKGYPNE